MNKIPIPIKCHGVKCMIQDCKKMAEHKVEEVCLWDENSESEEYIKFNQVHPLTTYLCASHFTYIMWRDEKYSQEDDRFDKDDPRLK